MKKKQFYRIIDEIKAECPYPEDIFVGLTEEGLRGKAARIAWNNCCEDIRRKVEKYRDD